MRRYQDFKAWQLAAELNSTIFALTSAPPSFHDFRFRDNIRDAADSAQRNFPEGFGRFAPGDFARFLDHSRASLLEVKNELAVGLDRGYFRPEDVDAATITRETCAQGAFGIAAVPALASGQTERPTRACSSHRAPRPEPTNLTNLTNLTNPRTHEPTNPLRFSLSLASNLLD